MTRWCILDNDHLDAAVVPLYQSYAAMFIRLLQGVGEAGPFAVFNTVEGQYPSRFDDYDVILLTGSRADAFADTPWVLRLRAVVSDCLAQGRRLIGVCFGHQLIAHCLGAPVGRAPQGWGVGRSCYMLVPGALPALDCAGPLHLLASHQDQVAQLPPGARLLAHSDFCPVAAYALADQVLCVQPHPEFVPEYSAYLLEKRRASLGDARVDAALKDLPLGHDGAAFARLMLEFARSGRA